MDNEKIHIDELVRGKLSGREEDERAGAWMNMRELLDKNMPAGQVATGSRAKRLIGYFALLSLLTAATVGGYQVMNRQGAGGQNEMIAEGRTSGNAGGNTLLQGNTEEQGASGQRLSGGSHSHYPGHAGSISQPVEAESATGPSAAIAGSGMKNTTQDVEANHSGESGNTVAGSAANVRQRVQTKHSAQSGDPIAGSGINAKQTVEANHSAKSGNVVAGSAIDAKQDPETIHSAQSGEPNAGFATNAMQRSKVARSGNNKDSENLSVSAKDAPKGRQESAPASGEHKSGLQTEESPALLSGGVSSVSPPVASFEEHEGQIFRGDAASGGRNRQPVGSKGAPSAVGITGASTRPAPGDGAGQMSGKSGHESYVLRHDTLTKISLVYRTILDPLTRAKHTELDTASVAQMVVERKIPVPVQDLSVQTAYGKRRKPGIGVLASAAEEQQSMSSAAARSRQKRRSKQQRFDDMLLNARINLSQMQFYPGITGGINAMFSGGTFIPGFQLGFQGEMEFNDRWTVMTELRYITRFSNGKTIEDNYIGGPVYSDSVFRGGSLVSRVYTRDSVAHSYNFSTLGTLNLPISLRYSVRKFFMAAGVDLVYHFRTNAEEVSGTVQLRDTLSAGAALPASWTPGDKTISLDDLRGRFGVGYLIGAGYRVNPNLHLDLRMTRMFWDNAGSGGAGKVSDQLFRMPAFQFSVGYRLGGRMESQP